MSGHIIPAKGIVEKARKLKKRSLPSPASPGEGVPTGRDGWGRNSLSSLILRLLLPINGRRKERKESSKALSFSWQPSFFNKPQSGRPRSDTTENGQIIIGGGHPPQFFFFLGGTPRNYRGRIRWSMVTMKRDHPISILSYQRTLISRNLSGFRIESGMIMHLVFRQVLVRTKSGRNLTATKSCPPCLGFRYIPMNAASLNASWNELSIKIRQKPPSKRGHKNKNNLLC